MRNISIPTAALDLEVSDGTQFFDVPVGDSDQFRIETVQDSGAWAAGVISVQWTISNVNFYPFLDSDGNAVTLSSVTGTGLYAVDGIAKLRFIVTTDQSGTPGKARVWIGFSGTALQRLAQYYNSLVS
jgi:hypothetical protein